MTGAQIGKAVANISLAVIKEFMLQTFEHEPTKKFEEVHPYQAYIRRQIRDEQIKAAAEFMGAGALFETKNTPPV